MNPPKKRDRSKIGATTTNTPGLPLDTGAEAPKAKAKKPAKAKKKAAK